MPSQPQDEKSKFFLQEILAPSLATRRGMIQELISELHLIPGLVCSDKLMEKVSNCCPGWRLQARAPQNQAKVGMFYQVVTVTGGNNTE